MTAATAHPAAPPPLPPVPARAGGLYLVIPEELTGLFPGGLRGLFPSRDDGDPEDAAALADGWPQEWPGEPEQPDDGQSAGRPTRPEVFKAGRWDRSSGDGPGFASGGVADRLPPGATLAGLAGDAWERGLDRLSDDELIGVMRAARRLASWAAAMELASVADLWRRRLAEDKAGEAGAAAGTGDEIAAALTLTGRSADKLLNLAVALDRLPATSAALAAGDIDLPRASVIAEELTGLSDEHAAAVEQAVIGAAPRQTTGQLRRAAHRAVLAADPAAARQRKEEALREARVERWTEPAGTAALAGRDLPPAAVLAADANLTGLAHQLKAAGADGTMDNLRARIYLALLTGAPVTSLLPASPATGPGSPAGLARPATGSSASSSPPPAGQADASRRERHDQPGSCGDPGEDGSERGDRPGPGDPGSPRLGPVDPSSPGPGSARPGLPGLSGRVNLTLPLSTWLGSSDTPGHVPGYGPLDAADARTLADALAARAGSKWCLTLTDERGSPVAHGCARPRPAAGKRRAPPAARSPDGTPPPAPVSWTFTISLLEQGQCGHARQTAGYRPSPGLRHVIEIRRATCTFPGCARPATQCDEDHTVPYHLGGRTCECNLAPLCRRHHQVKQARGWTLEQTSPGVMTWTTPAGRRYRTSPTEYPS